MLEGTTKSQRKGLKNSLQPENENGSSHVVLRKAALMLDFARCLLANPIASLAPKGKKSGRAREKIDVPRINSGHGRAPPRTRLPPPLLSRPALGRLRRAGSSPFPRRPRIRPGGCARSQQHPRSSTFAGLLLSDACLAAHRSRTRYMREKNREARRPPCDPWRRRRGRAVGAFLRA